MVKITGEADTENLLNTMENMLQICTVFLTLGNYNLFLIASVKDTMEFYEVVEKIRLMDGVASADTSTIITRRKLLNKIIKE